MSDLLLKNNIDFFSGVPEVVRMSSVMSFQKRKNIKNFTAPNEIAVSLGIGHYLSKKKIPLVYLQNSGLGITTDPITNLMSKYVYNIPLIL